MVTSPQILTVWVFTVFPLIGVALTITIIRAHVRRELEQLRRDARRQRRS